MMKSSQMIGGGPRDGGWSMLKSLKIRGGSMDDGSSKDEAIPAGGEGNA